MSASAAAPTGRVPPRVVPDADLDLLVLGDCNPDLILRGGAVEPAFGQAERLIDAADLTIGGSGRDHGLRSGPPRAADRDGRGARG